MAERLSSDGVAVRIGDGLVPGLAEDLKGRAVVVFVDEAASLEPGPSPSPASRGRRARTHRLTHHVGPETLLRLATQLYGAKSLAFLVTMGALVGPWRGPVGPVAAALPEAAALVRRLIASAE